MLCVSREFSSTFCFLYLHFLMHYYGDLCLLVPGEMRCDSWCLVFHFLYDMSCLIYNQNIW